MWRMHRLPDLRYGRGFRHVSEKWLLTVGKYLGFLVSFLRKGTNILLVKGTLHTGMKEPHAKTTMITSASSDVSCLKKSLKKKKKKKKKIFIITIT